MEINNKFVITSKFSLLEKAVVVKDINELRYGDVVTIIDGWCTSNKTTTGHNEHIQEWTYSVEFDSKSYKGKCRLDIKEELLMSCVDFIDKCTIMIENTKAAISEK